MTIRPLTEIPEFAKCVELQREAWEAPDIDLVPARMYVVQSRIGGLILGAFDRDRLVGYLTTMPGIQKDGMPYWHSQMMAVAAII